MGHGLGADVGRTCSCLEHRRQAVATCCPLLKPPDSGCILVACTLAVPLDRHPPLHGTDEGPGVAVHSPQLDWALGGTPSLVLNVPGRGRTAARGGRTAAGRSVGGRARVLP